MNRRVTQGNAPSLHHSRKAFSLLELSIVLVIISVVATMGLELANQFIARRAYTETMAKVTAVDAALDKFYWVYGRLPCPANRTLLSTNSNFGVESCQTTTNVAWSGTLPFRTLNLPLDEVIDSYGNQLNYVVTKNLELASSFASTAGAITVRSGQLNAACTSNCEVLTTSAAYAVFSAGPNKEGGASRIGVTTGCTLTDGTFRIDEQNCAVAIDAAGGVTGIGYVNTLLYDSRYNTALMPANYFDDIILWRTKGRL